MIMLVAIVGSAVALVAFVIFITMTVYDMKLLRAHRRFTHFRQQPFVSIVIDDDISDETIRSISRSDYRKYEIIFVGEPIESGIVLELRRNMRFAPATIRHAVLQLTNLPDCQFVEIKPTFMMPENLRELYQLYEYVILAPLISVRAQLKIRPFAHARWPVIRSTALAPTFRSYTYRAVVWLMSIANAITMLYVSYLAIWLDQPELLLLYIATFSLWLIISLWDYPYLSVKDKMIYTFLAPVSFGYFYMTAIWAPFVEPLRLVSRLAGKFFSRTVHQTVV